MTDPTASAPSSSGSSTSILSSKVARALQVRTDTPAMKAALEALGALEEKEGDHPGHAVVDSRSVRVAMEQDAWQQALLLQDELRSLVQVVSDLREGVAQTAALAHCLQQALSTPVVVAAETTVLLSSGVGGTAETDASATPQQDSASTTPFQAEQALALQLAQAFDETRAAQRRVAAVEAFLDQFDLSRQDARLLDHYAFEDVASVASGDALPVNGQAFLKALSRVRRIRATLSQTFGSTSSVLLNETTDHNDHGPLGASSALRMMESLAQKQERAYERLYHWLQQHLHLLGTTSSGSAAATVDPDDLDQALQHPFVKQALWCLRDVPAFYSHTLELVAGSRRTEETRRFLLALTSGYGGRPPLELKAHDAVQYVGEMLAFCFQALSVEADVVQGIVLYEQEQEEEDAEKEGDEEKRQGDTPTDDYLGMGDQQPMTAGAMLSICVSGLARPLKSRILQVIDTLARRSTDQGGQQGGDRDDDLESDDGMTDDYFHDQGHVVRTRLTHLYEICGLLLFYASAMNKALAKLEEEKEETTSTSPSEATKDATTPTVEKEDDNPLISCMQDCLVEASKAFEATTRVYCAMLPQVTMSTGQSEASLVHSMLVLIADVRTSSPGFSADVPRPANCSTLLSMDWVAETLIEAALPTCRTLDDVMTLNQSLTAAKKAGMGVVAAEKLEEEMEQREAALIEEFVLTETKKALDLCGLGPLVSAWKRWQEVQADGTLMATYPGLSPDSVQAGMKEFYASLYSPPLPSLETVIKDPALRKSVRTRVAANVCDFYSDLYGSIMSSSQGGYDDVSCLGHTPEQVKTLFSA